MKVLYITNNYPNEYDKNYGIFVKEQIDSVGPRLNEFDILFINAKAYGKFHYVLAVFRVYALLLRKRYNIIHVHHAFSGIPILISGIWAFSKVILSYQNPPEHEGGIILFKLFQIFFSGIIVKHSSKIVGPKFHYLPNGVNQDIFGKISRIEAREKLNISADDIVFLHIDSNPEKRTQKRYDRFIDVIRILEANYNLKISTLKATSVDRMDMKYYFAASNLYLVTSDFEGSPNAVKESLYIGTPVVTTPVGNTSEIFGDRQTIFCSSTFNPEDLAERCFDVLSGDYSVEGMDIQSLREVSNKLISIYENIV